MNKEQAELQRNIITIRIEEPIVESQKSHIAVGASSIIGTRKNQQDSIYTSCGSDMAIAVVCDGMGGMEGGELASQLAIRILSQEYEEREDQQIPEFYRKAVIHMDNGVSGLVRENGESMNAGTTVVSAVIQDDKLYWLSVGDSRIYIVRGNEFEQVTRDHNYKLRLDNLLQEDLISREDYLSRIAKGEALISYIGMGNVTLMDINPIPFQLCDGDTILLCSDGLYKRLEDKEIQKIICRELPNVDQAAQKLTQIVMEKTTGSQDNTSVILMQYHQYLS